ncbi:hypothetical protein Hanom_Chr13g01185471 [Helianthus anomalus]
MNINTSSSTSPSSNPSSLVNLSVCINDFFTSNQTQLRHIVKATGGWFSGLKGRAGIKFADKNGNIYV